MSNKNSSIKKNYYWVLFAVVFLSVFTVIGIENNRASLFLIPVTESLGISRGVFSLSTSIKSILAVLSNFAFGFLYGKFGYRRLASVGAAVVAVSLFLCGAAKSFALLFAATGIMGLADCGTGLAISSRIITEWFHRRRGLVLGAISAASGIGGAVMSLVLNRLIEGISWRSAFFFSAGAVFLIALLIALFARNSPRNLGLEPYGLREAEEKGKPAPARDAGILLRDLKRKPGFYFTLFGVLLMMLAVYGMFSIIAPHIVDRGMSSSAAAAVQSFFFIMMACAKLAEGFLSDRLGIKRVLLGAIGIGVIGIALFAVAKSSAGAIAAVSLYAFATAIPSVMLPQLVSDLYGQKDYSAILGIFYATVSVNNIIITPIVNFSHDYLGTYTPVLLCCSLALALSGVIVLLSYRGMAKAY